MDYMYDLLVKLCLGVIVLLFSTQVFIQIAKKMSHIVKISPLIIGATFVAIGTSLPELVVSMTAVLQKDTGLAMGNIIGSNIVNIFLVLPVAIFTGKLRIGTNKTQRNALIMVGITLIFIFIQFLKPVPIASGLFLIILALLVTVLEFEQGVFGRNHEDSLRFNKKNHNRITILAVIIAVLSIVGIIMGGILVVSSIESISRITGYSTTILGLSLTAVATSLPELLTTVIAQEEHQEKMTIGNISGSNIYNLLLVGGLTMIFTTGLVIASINWIWLIISTVGFAYILRRYKGIFIPKRLGAVLILLFIVYLFTLGIK